MKHERSEAQTGFTIVLLCLAAALAGCGDALPRPVPDLQAHVDSILPPGTEEELAEAARAKKAGAGLQVSPEIPSYEPTKPVAGTIVSVGSDTMNNVMALWAGGFQQFHPNVLVEVEGKGSSTAPAALIEGRANFGPMSRPMKGEEEDEFEEEFGYKPTALRAAIDMLAVYVHKDNPIRELTLAEVDAIFSRNRKRGFGEDIRTWGQVGGLGGRWARKRISTYGRNSASGTYGFFKEVALRKGDFKGSVKEQPGSSSVVQGVANDVAGIGYSGIGHRTADVIPVSLAAREGRRYIPPVPEHAYTGRYPLARHLYLYINKLPNTELDPLNAEFVRYIFSRQGQQALVKDGYYPVSAVMARSTLESLGLE